MRSRTKASFPDCTEFCRVEIPARTQRCLSKIAHPERAVAAVTI